MCGRFALYAEKEAINSHYHLNDHFIMKPRYNVAPTQTIPIIVHSPKELQFAKWGFIPGWVKPNPLKPPAEYINARYETLLEKPAFKSAFSRSRCLIPASGYYEWKDINGKKQPFFIALKNKSLFSLAGIWSLWRHSQWETVMTCAILTQPAHDEFARLHERMPMIIAPKDYDTWLNPKEKLANLEKIQQGTLAYDWSIFPVSKQVNSPQIDTALCVQAL